MKSFVMKLILCLLFFNFHLFFQSTNLSNLEWIKIPAGEFSFDNSYYFKFNETNKESKENKIKVKISPFSITKTPVKRIQWEKLLGEEKFAPWDEYEKKCPECYAENLKYPDVILFLNKLSLKDFGKEGNYRLPTESEMYYLFSVCENNSCKEMKSMGGQMQITSSVNYKNKFGFLENKEDVLLNSGDYSIVGGLPPKTKYIWTSDFPSNGYLSGLLNEKSEYVNPKPTADSKFNYGKILLSLYLTEKSLQINRLGHSINMLPDNASVFFYIVSEKK